MFDFDVVTGPGNGTSLTKPVAPPSPKLTSPPAPPPAPVREDGREPPRPAHDPAAVRP